MAIEEFNGFGRILIPKGKKKWGWCGFVEMLQYLLSPFTSVTHAPPIIIVPLPSLKSVPTNHSFAQVVATI